MYMNMIHVKVGKPDIPLQRRATSHRDARAELLSPFDGQQSMGRVQLHFFALLSMPKVLQEQSHSQFINA